ncbi:THAP domain-containing protein 1-like [Metopolophium dirhodum]|uniref:THAP domain-containing protein 1-like n=1 Tax=Metopolophium dirhodum TaxID=44670 RepID=UPI00299038FD|nr:THAP domain-containing protein 1-like [Metopolophium dirhodum]
MVCSCSVHLCTNRSKPGPPRIHFFSFPLKSAERTQQWVNAVGRKGFIPTKHSKVCSDHFHQNDFEQKSGDSYLIKLKVTAVPSIFPNYSDIISKAKKQCLEVEPFQVVVCSSYIPCTETNKPEMLNDGDCVIVDETTSVKIISPLESTSNNQDCNLSTQNSLFKISLPKRPSSSPSKSELKKKIKSLQQRVRRQNKSIKNLKDLLKVLKKKNLIEKEAEELLMEKFDCTTLDIFQPC